MNKILLALVFLCAACADTAANTAPPVHASGFVYDPKAPAVESVTFVYDANAPAIRASAFHMPESP